MHYMNNVPHVRSLGVTEEAMAQGERICRQEWTGGQVDMQKGGPASGLGQNGQSGQNGTKRDKTGLSGGQGSGH